MHEIVFDLETTVNGGPDGTCPEAHWDANSVLACAYMYDSRIRVDKTVDGLVGIVASLLNDDEDVRLIAHNLKFDLKYLMREYPEVAWHRVDTWCTQHHEYRHSGQRHKMISLENLCDLRKIGYTKSLDLGKWLAGGNKMEDIPWSDLKSYAHGDVHATHAVYLDQILESPIEYFQWHIPAITSMELNGLPLDSVLCMKELNRLQQELIKYESSLFQWADAHLIWSNGDRIKEGDLKYMSPRTVSYILTGEPSAGLTPNRVRKRLELRQKPLMSTYEISTIWGTVPPTNLGYPLNKQTMEAIMNLNNQDAEEYMLLLSAQKQATKLANTYFGPFLETGKIQGHVYPKINLSVAATGRTSSSNPNGQNMPPRARNVFHSKHGYLYEIDFAQLEVCALAAVSKDPQLIADINNGVDLHYQTGKDVMGWKSVSDMKSSDRKLVKNVNFGLIYGGSAGGLSKQTGQPRQLVQSLIDSFYKRYPRVAKWQSLFYTDVVDQMKPAGFVGGEQIYDSIVTEPVSGRRFYFKEQKAPVWIKQRTGRGYNFKPTETKNYPVQGFAGGDIVMRAVAGLYEEVADRDLCDLRMTVHDSILVDTHMTTQELRSIMQKVCHKIEKELSLPIQLKFDITSGQLWK